MPWPIAYGCAKCKTRLPDARPGRRRVEPHGRGDVGLPGRLLTPAHASWLNQAELLVNAFGGRYLKRGSWASREEFSEHVAVSWAEYNRLYAHPFEWTWSPQKMRKWFGKHRH
jgi:hypothetical protein